MNIKTETILNLCQTNRDANSIMKSKIISLLKEIWIGISIIDKKLEHWKSRVKNELDSYDLVDVLKLIEHMEDIESSTLWIIRCINALLLLRKQ